MKNSIILSAIAITVCGMMFSSCDKIKSAIASPASITWSGIDVSINLPPGSDTLLHTSMGTGSFTYNLDSFIKKETNNLLGLSDIDTFQVTSCTLTILNPDSTDNFGNFEVAEASLYSNANTTPAAIGEIDNNPAAYASVLSLPVSNNTNLRSYIPSSGATTITYTVGGKLRAPTTATLTVSVHIEYYIHVKP